MPNFGDLRSLLHEPATAESWERFTALVERFDWEAEHAPFLDYVDEGASRWADDERIAPLGWVSALIQDRAVFAMRWVRTMMLPVVRDGALGALPSRPELSALSGLIAWRWPDINELLALLRSPQLGPLRRLDLSYTALDEVFMGHLCELPWFGAHVEELQLHHISLTQGGVDWLGSALPSSIQALGLAFNPLDERSYNALFRDRELAALRRLDLRRTSTDDRCVERLVAGQPLANMAQLFLSDNPLTMSGLAQLMSKPALIERLEQLALDDVKVGDAGVTLLARQPWQRLRVLTMWGAGLSAEGHEALRAITTS